MVLGTLVYIALIIIVIIVIVVLLKFLFGVLFVAPIATENFIDPETFYTLTEPTINDGQLTSDEIVAPTPSDI
jgi:hypothetical protein